MLALSLVSGAGLGLVPTAPVRAPTAAQLRSPAPAMGLESELGATGPLLPYWDPLGMSVKNPDKFTRWRSVEIKHGRVAMAACTGYIVQSIFRFPGYLSPTEGIAFADLPNGIAAVKAMPAAGIWQVFLFIAIMEVRTWRAYDGTGPWDFKARSDVAPGDWAGEYWVRYSDPEEKKTKLNIELNNGRAAMMGSLGMLMHDHLLGTWIPPGF